MRIWYLIIPFTLLLIVGIASATIITSPKEPVINGNGYTFVVFYNTSYANQNIHLNITNPSNVAKSSGVIQCNEYGYAKRIYNFSSSDISGTWHYQTNTTDGNGDFQVGKITLSVFDKFGKSFLNYGSSTKIITNLSYEVFLPKEVLCTHQSRDFGTHLAETMIFDFDGDGMPEIVFSDSVGRLYIEKYGDILNGSYLRWQSYDVGSFAVGNGGVTVGDFDDDGNYTLIATDTTEVETFEITSLAGSQANVAVTVKQTIAATVCRPVTADINGDGIPDQIAIMATDGSTYFYNYSEGSGFTQLLDSDKGAGTAEGRLLVDDFDGDGLNEYIAIHSDTGAWYYDVNHTSGAVTAGDQAPDKGTYLCYGASCDWDNDGTIEAILPLTLGKFQVIYYNTTTNTLEEDITWNIDIDQGTFSNGASQVQINDLNCNGRPDFISVSMTATGAESPSVYFNEYEPGGDWYQELICTFLDTSYTPVTYVDFDGDGIDEFVIYGRLNGMVEIYKYNGTGFERIYEGWLYGEDRNRILTGDAVRYGAVLQTGWGNAPSVAYDFDQDGREEMIAFPYSGVMLVYQLEDRVERNTTPELFITIDTPEGAVNNNKYIDLRLISTNETLAYTENVALGKTGIVDDDGENQGSISPLWTDGILSLDETYYATQKGTGYDYSTIDASIVEDASWCQLDLGDNYTIGRIKIWNYFSDNRQFENVKLWTGTSSNPANIIFDNSADGAHEEYPEGVMGKAIYITPTEMRYIRESTAGSNYYTTLLNTGNLRTEIEVYECETPQFTIFTFPESESSVTDYYNVTVTVSDRCGTIINVVGNINYSVRSFSLYLNENLINATGTLENSTNETGFTIWANYTGNTTAIHTFENFINATGGLFYNLNLTGHWLWANVTGNLTASPLNFANNLVNVTGTNESSYNSTTGWLVWLNLTGNTTPIHTDDVESNVTGTLDYNLNNTGYWVTSNHESQLSTFENILVATGTHEFGWFTDTWKVWANYSSNSTNLTVNNNTAHTTGPYETSYNNLTGWELWMNFTGQVPTFNTYENVVNATGTHEEAWDSVNWVHNTWANYTGNFTSLNLIEVVSGVTGTHEYKLNDSGYWVYANYTGNSTSANLSFVDNLINVTGTNASHYDNATGWTVWLNFTGNTTPLHITDIENNVSGSVTSNLNGTGYWVVSTHESQVNLLENLVNTVGTHQQSWDGTFWDVWANYTGTGGSTPGPPGWCPSTAIKITENIKNAEGTTEYDYNMTSGYEVWTNYTGTLESESVYPALFSEAGGMLIVGGLLLLLSLFLLYIIVKSPKRRVVLNRIEPKEKEEYKKKLSDGREIIFRR